MNASTEAWQTFADQLMKGSPGSPPRTRAEMEDTLVPMVRCAIRTGRGYPPLVQWVRSHLFTRGKPMRDAIAAAPAIARQLCSEMMHKPVPQHAQETVVGW